MAKKQFVILALLINHQILASPWQPLAGKTNYYAKGRYLNADARKLKKMRGHVLSHKTEMVNAIYKDQYLLMQQRDQKIAKLKEQDRYDSKIIQGINNNYDELIAYGQKLIAQIDKDAFMYNVYPDQFALEAGFEYGINEYFSTDLGILYNYRQFRQTRYCNYEKVVKQISLGLKAKLYTYGNLIVSLEHKFFAGDFGKIIELNLLSGYSANFKKLKSYRSIGCGIGKDVKNYDKNVYFTFLYAEGVEFNNGIMLNVHNKYRVGKKTLSPYCRSLYTESSIAKKFKLKSHNFETIIISMGYFWDKSLRYNIAATSGFTASIWLET